MRDWLKGSTANAGNHWVEIEVWGSRTRVQVGEHYEKDLKSGVVTKYCHFGGSRVALQRGGVVQYLLGDHLGSTSLTVDGSGNKVAELRYRPYGETRYSGPPYGTPTEYRFTGQRQDGGVRLVHMGARWYDAELGRWLSADTLVPDPANPQSLNRYSYVQNSPVVYVDPSGRAAWGPFALAIGAGFVGGRVGYELATAFYPGADRDRRDQIGGALVTSVSEAIEAQNADATVVSAILRHESAAFERRAMTLWPTMQPGAISDAAEGAQALIAGDQASIGPGQMQLRRAAQLEQLGYVKTRGTRLERISALLNGESAVEYVAGMVRYLSDQLHTMSGFSDLSAEQQQRLVLIGYNVGLEGHKGLLANILKYGFQGAIDIFGYDEETLDEYLRWVRQN